MQKSNTIKFIAILFVYSLFLPTAMAELKDTPIVFINVTCSKDPTNATRYCIEGNQAVKPTRCSIDLSAEKPRSMTCDSPTDPDTQFEFWCINGWKYDPLQVRPGTYNASCSTTRNACTTKAYKSYSECWVQCYSEYGKDTDCRESCNEACGY